MARIIKPAPIQSPVEVTCKFCKAVVEFERQDMTFTGDQRDGDYYSAPCPSCGVNINVGTGQVPDWRPYV